MQLQNKYTQVLDNLQSTESPSFSGSVQEASYYYFKTLSELSLDILLQSSEITELSSKIEFMKSRFSSMSAKYAQKKRKQEQKRIIHCEHENCKVTFLKEKELHYHKIFCHEDGGLFENTVFAFRAEEDSME